jgi:hypothetical protein
VSLSLSLRLDGERLLSTFHNAGSTPRALTFWWNRRLVVRDVNGHLVKPGPGPVLPCGVAEDWTVLEPGASHEREETLACTQPAGRTEDIGWSYEALAAGQYRVSLVWEAPPAHGFTQSEADQRAFVGRLESNEVVLQVPEKPKGWFARMLGR